LMGKHKARQS